MQTKQQIQRLLASAGVEPNKRLGQHYLIDLNLMRLLIDSAGIESNDVVLEVGCGTGSLTEAIAECAGYCIAVELDPTTAAIAKRQLADAENVQIICADILRSKNTISRTVIDAMEDQRKCHDGRNLLVANLPYNVASSVMVNLITTVTTVDGMYVTVQKEVAQRMTASPGSAEYGTLSIFLNATGQANMIRVLKPTVFWPQPQVSSAMVGYLRSEQKVNRIANMHLFVEMVHLFMGHRRKMLKACTKFAQEKLKEIRNWQEVFERASVDPQNRAEQILPEQYIMLANLCSEQLSEK